MAMVQGSSTWATNHMPASLPVSTHLYIQLWCVAALRLQEYLVGLLVSKANNLVLDGGAVPGDSNSGGVV